MIQLNPQYEAIFDARNIDEDCNRIADEINDVVRMQIKEILAVGMYKQAVTLYLQLLKSMVNHFVDDEHFCYFDDMYSPEYSLQWIYEDIMKYDIDEESRKLIWNINIIYSHRIGCVRWGHMWIISMAW